MSFPTEPTYTIGTNPSQQLQIQRWATDPDAIKDPVSASRTTLGWENIVGVNKGEIPPLKDFNWQQFATGEWIQNLQEKVVYLKNNSLVTPEFISLNSDVQVELPTGIKTPLVRNFLSGANRTIFYASQNITNFVTETNTPYDSVVSVQLPQGNSCMIDFHTSFTYSHYYVPDQKAVNNSFLNLILTFFTGQSSVSRNYYFPGSGLIYVDNVVGGLVSNYYTADLKTFLYAPVDQVNISTNLYTVYGEFTEGNISQGNLQITVTPLSIT